VTDIASAPESTTVYSDTPEEREFELRAAIGSYWMGGRLFIGMFTFLLASEAFAYFYLRSSNNGQLWRPGNQTAPTGIGWSIFVVVVVSVSIAIFGHSRLRKGNVLDWEVAGWTAVLGGLVATGLQIWQLTQLPFFPGSSGYASCFIGWAVMNIVMLLSGTYWMSAATADGPDQLAATSSGQIFRANVAACTYFWGFMAAGSTLFWVMFYLI
jgi:heme/copper-type cytochrome/quinol oxidase subunit 3